MLSRALRSSVHTSYRVRTADAIGLVRGLRSEAETIVIKYAAPAAVKPSKQGAMFCYQCEQTEAATGCTTVGVVSTCEWGCPVIRVRINQRATRLLTLPRPLTSSINECLDASLH